MVNLQSNFMIFHDEIKLKYDDNSLLRNYRDQVLDGLQEHLETDNEFSYFLQGSYPMHTGIKSTDENIDFDIDVGLSIDTSRTESPNPVYLKTKVRDAMKETFPNASVEIKTPCVTIDFSEVSHNKKVHVDVAIYANEDDNYFLAKGKEFSSEKYRCWEESDPLTLKDKVKSYLNSSEDRKQFRRCVRYLKRWKDKQFKQVNRPTSIGLTVLALEKFEVNKTLDSFTSETKYNDLAALTNFVNQLLSNFNHVTYDDDNDRYYNRIQAQLPVKPYSDTFSKLTANQMIDFYNKLDLLYKDLTFASNTLNEYEATKKLNKQFGDDFEITPEDDVVEASNKNAFVTDYPSA